MINHLSIPQYLLESSFCLVIFYAFYSLFLKRETYFQINRGYLLISAFASLIIPLININYSQASQVTGAEQILPILSSVEIFQTGIHKTIARQSDILHISVADLISYVYICGLFVMSIKLLSGLFKLFGIIHRCPKMKNDDRTLLISSDVPASSFFSYIFWNDKHDKNDETQKTIMDHEMVHVRQWHSLDVIMMELMVIVKWFNPLIYLFKNSLRQTHEYIADQYVTDKMVDKVTYANILLTNQANTDLPPATNHFYGHVTDRIRMLGKAKSKKISQFKLLGIIPISIILFSLFSFDLSDKLPDQIKTPFQAIETSMLATADQNVLSLHLDEKVKNEKFYVTWGDEMNLVLTQHYKTQDYIFQYKRSDLQNLLSETPTITQGGKNLAVHIDTLEVIHNNIKKVINLDDLKTDALRKKFVDSLRMHDQILVSLKSYSDTDSLRINLHLSIDKEAESPFRYVMTGMDPKKVIKWGDIRVEFDDKYFEDGTRLNLNNIVSPDILDDLLNQKILISKEDGTFEDLDTKSQVSFKYKRVRHDQLAVLNLDEISKSEMSKDKDVTFLTTHYYGKNYKVYENSYSYTLEEMYLNKESLELYLLNAENGDNISVNIINAGEGNQKYSFNLRFKDDNDATSAPFAISLPHTADIFTNYQIVMNTEGKSLVRIDTENRSSRHIVDAYKNSQSYEIVHIKDFKTKSHVYSTNLPQGNLEIVNFKNPALANINHFRLNDHYTAGDQLIRMDWGKMISMPNIGNYSLKEFKRSSKYDLMLFAGTQPIKMERFDLLIIPENGKIRRVRTDKVNTTEVRDILRSIDSNTSIYVDNIIVNIEGAQKYYPYNFVYTLE